MRLFKIVVLIAAFLSCGQILRPLEALAAPSVTALTCTPPATDPEIAALARALNYNLSLIYEYVYFNVEFSPTFGSKKGALGTYLDRRGNNFDQNVLFVALLRQSCISANFRYGGVTYPAASVANWLGVQNDAGLLSTILGYGGIPATVSASTVVMNVVWTEVTAGGSIYELDPSYKSYTQYSPINLALATRYTQKTFLGAALSGSSSLSGLPGGAASIKVMLGAGEIGRDTLTRHQNLIAQYTQAGQAATSEPVTGESLAAIGATYLSQSARALQLLGSIGSTVFVTHESMGIAGIKSAPYVDFPGQLYSLSAATTSVTAAGEYGQILALAAYQSSLESTSVTQMQANPAISTVRMFDYANSDNTAILQANASNWSALQPYLTGWAASDLSSIGSWLSANSTYGQIFLPQNGSRTAQQF
jgi:hypothetical protein